MSDSRSWRLVLAVVVCAVFTGGRGLAREAPAEGEAKAAEPRSVRVENTFDGSPFSYRIALKEQGEGFRVFRISYPSPVTTDLEQNNTVPGEYYLPDNVVAGEAKRPAVICLHILNGNFELVRLLCSVLAARGIPAMMFKLPYYGERSPSGRPRVLLSNAMVFADALRQTVQDVRRAVDFLGSRPEVDAGKIGISGISLGGILAGSSAGMEPRLHRAVFILAGGDLLEIAHHARETRKLSGFIKKMAPAERDRVEALIRSVDPLSHVSRLRELAQSGRVLMLNASEDQVIPKACTAKLAKAIGIENEVVWLRGLGHYTAMAALPQLVDATVEFFARDLPPGVEPAKAATAPSTPLAMLGRVVQDFASMLVVAPAEGRCHFLDLSAVITDKRGKKHSGEIQFIRGTRGRFRLRCRLPEIGAAAMGQCEYPWMASVGKKAFRGVNDPVEGGNPLMCIEPQLVMRARMAGGFLGGMGVAPQALEHMIDIARKTADNGAAVVVVNLKGKQRGKVEFRFRPDGKTPDQATFDVQGVSGTLVFRQWQVNAMARDELFGEPRDLPSQDVLQQDVYRTFAGLAHFVAEKVQ